MAQDPEHGLEQAMGRMLQIGVTAAAMVVLVGGVLFLAQSPGVRPDYQHFQPALTTVHGIAAQAFSLTPAGIVGFGILLLIATPICRVLFGVVGFAMLRDRLYTAISAIVLVILLFSFFTSR